MSDEHKMKATPISAPVTVVRTELDGGGYDIYDLGGRIVMSTPGIDRALILECTINQAPTLQAEVKRLRKALANIAEARTKAQEHQYMGSSILQWVHDIARTALAESEDKDGK